jgi:sortase B
MVLDLRAEYGNDDIIGYLYMPGTQIDFPIVQARNNSYYLDHNIHKRYDTHGAPFLDYENDVSGGDRNTIIYGHNTRERKFFHEIRYFNGNRQYFNDNRYIIFDTLYEYGVWEVFAFYQTHINFYYIQVDFADDAEFYSLAREMVRRSQHSAGITIAPGDRILTLSTCTNVYDDTRYVLNARLVTDPIRAAEIRAAITE